ncbi:MAG: PAS domain S-box protein [Alphaproteobacteria bacterium]|nr:PAS domain S-box protein [Alphaproteobacteria bacterium SS10]
MTPSQDAKPASDSPVTSADSSLTAAAGALGAVLDGVAHGVAIFDQDDKLVAYNAPFVELHNDTVTIAEGMGYAALIEACIDANLFADQALARGMLQGVMDNADGDPLDLLTAEHRWLRIEDSRVAAGRIAIRQDITEWKQAAMALRESEGRMRVLSDASLEGLLMHHDGVIGDCNNAAANLFGIAQDQLVGRDPGELVASIDRSRLMEAIARDTGNVIEITCLKGDGSPFLAEARTRRIPTRDGIAGVISLRDVTERLRVQETLRRREAILSAVGVAAENFLADEDWRETLTNVLERLGTAAGVSHVFVHMLQRPENNNGDAADEGEVFLPKDYLAAERWAWTAPGYGDPLFQDKLEEFDPVASGLAEMADLRRGRPAIEALSTADEELQELMDYVGVQSFCLFPIRPFDDELDPLWGIVGFLQLDQPREWLDIEVETLSTAVDLVVAALRRERAAGQLTQARDAAERASRAKSEFLAVMSHEIRTPMNAVLGMLSLLSSSELNEEQRDFAETARDAANGLMTIIEDILDISKMEAGRLILENRDFDLIEQVEGLVDLFSARAQGQGLRISADIPFDVPRYLRGDVGRLRQILLNLLGNAIKFTNEGGIRISVKPVVTSLGNAESADGTSTDPTITLRFEVSDTGIGIAPEEQEALFGDFYQGSPVLNRKHGGTGLGLAICRRLTELLSGDIGVTSRPDSGSTFWFTAKLRLPHRARAEAPMPPAGSGKRYLILAPPSIIRESLVAQLDGIGCEVEVADDLSDLPVEFHYSATLIDARLFRRDLPTLPKEIAVASPAAGRVILVDQPRQRAERELHLAGGFADILPVPFHRSDIEALIKGQPIPRKRTRLKSGEDEATAKAMGPRALALVVDDSLYNQQRLSEMLDGQSMQSITAGNATGALEQTRDLGVDLAIIDLMTPSVNGMALVERLRSQPETAEIQIIGLINPEELPDASTVSLLTASMPRDAEALEISELITHTMQPEDGMGGDGDLGHASQDNRATNTAGGRHSMQDDPTDETIDRQVIDGMRETIGDDVVDDLIDSFEVEARDRGAKIALALTTEDIKAVGEEAHAMKSLAGSFGAPRLMAMTASLEKTAKLLQSEEPAEEPDKSLISDEMAAQIEEEVEQVILALRAIPILDRVGT